jgi:ubiquinone/menaquinone biosynthesis C-methylase UbiE
LDPLARHNDLPNVYVGWRQCDDDRGRNEKMISAELQPDQRPDLWDDHVCVYETVFEPFTMGFAERAAATLHLRPHDRVLDVGAGSGGTAIALAARGYAVTAIDASAKMVERMRARAAERGVAVDVQLMDGQALTFSSASFDAALSVLGVILFPLPDRGLSEMRRVVRPGGRVAVVTWTEPQSYELAAQLGRALQTVWPDRPSRPLPAQLRYRHETEFRTLFRDAGFADVTIETARSELKAPSARWLADRIAFAPGMAAAVSGLGERRAAVIEEFVRALEVRWGQGEIALGGVAFIGTATVA